MPEFEPLYTSDEMRAAEIGHDTSVLMERAGAAATQIALQVFAGAERWTVVCGGGANGGDGRIVAQQLEQAGKHVQDVTLHLGRQDVPHVLRPGFVGVGWQ